MRKHATTRKRRVTVKKTNRKSLVTALAAGALAVGTTIGTAGVAHAGQTISGAVGLPLNPTAQLPDRGTVHVQANFNDLGDISGNDLNLGGVYAAGRIGDRLEINGGLERMEGDQFLNPLDKTNVAIGAKYLLKDASKPGDVRIAAGAGYSRALLRNTYAYAVASKDVGGLSRSGQVPGTVHLGARYDDFDIRPGFLRGGDSNHASVYGGVEVPLTQSGAVSFVGELQSRNAEFGTSRYPYSASVRYRAGNGFSASAGVLREGITGDSGLFAQVGKTF
jgi:hypothetical protein